jgi:hypothetical protein
MGGNTDKTKHFSLLFSVNLRDFSVYLRDFSVYLRVTKILGDSYKEHFVTLLVLSMGSG